MKQRATHILVVVLVTCYLVVALTGHIAVLSVVLNSAGDSQCVTPEGKSKPIDSKPVWTQRKHIPTTPKIDIPADALVIGPRPHVPQPVFPVCVYHPSGCCSLEDFHPFFPRDPTIS